MTEDSRLPAWMQSRIARILLRVVPLVLLGVFLWREKPWTVDFSAVPVLPLLAVPLLNLVHMVFNAIRWRLVLRDPPGFLSTLAAVYEGQLAQMVVGFGSNDLVRTARLRTERGTFVSDIGPTLAERATENVSIGILVVATTLFGPMPPAAGIAAAAALGLYVLFLLSAARIAPRLERWGWPRVAHALAEARQALTGWKLTVLLVVSFIGWCVEVVQLMFVLGAFGLPHDAATATLVLVGINALVAIPGPPANFGTLEAGALGALFLLGIKGPTAVAFTVVYHLLHVVPTALLATTIFLVRGARRAEPESR